MKKRQDTERHAKERALRNSDGDQLCLGCGVVEPTAVHQANGAPAADIKGPTLFLRENTRVKEERD